MTPSALPAAALLALSALVLALWLRVILLKML